MAVQRVITEINASDPTDLNLVKALIAADGGVAEVTTDDDGTITVIATFPNATADVAMPSPGTDAFTWMKIARREIGQKEASGSADNPRIVEYSATTAGGATPDSVPWCSSFMNWCIEQTGFAGTDSKMARSWSSWGQKLTNPVPGAIIVLSRGSPTKGHVGFFVGEENGRWQLLGGNQGDKVSIASYDPSRRVAVRWPPGVAKP